MVQYIKTTYIDTAVSLSTVVLNSIGIDKENYGFPAWKNNLVIILIITAINLLVQ